MSFTLSFAISQDNDATSFTLTDQSSGSDTNVVQRRIVQTLADGTILVPNGTTNDHVNFPFSEGDSKEITDLYVDKAMSITLQYLDVSNTVLYTLSQSYAFTQNDEQFMYELCVYISANKSVLSDNGFVLNCFKLSMFVDYAQKAVETGNDLSGSQFLLDLAQEMVSNETKFF